MTPTNLTNRVRHIRRPLPIGAELGSLLTDKIKFKEISEMKRIRSDPMQFDPISRLANQTYLQLIAELLAGKSLQNWRMVLKFNCRVLTG